MIVPPPPIISTSVRDQEDRNREVSLGPSHPIKMWANHSELDQQQVEHSY